MYIVQCTYTGTVYILHNTHVTYLYININILNIFQRYKAKLIHCKYVPTQL